MHTLTDFLQKNTARGNQDKYLELVGIDLSQATDHEIKLLIEYIQTKDLKIISFAGTHLDQCTPSRLQEIFTEVSASKTIKNLDLSDNNFGQASEEVIKVLGEVIKNDGIEQLSLEKNDLAGGRAVTFLKSLLSNNPNTKNVGFSFNQLGSLSPENITSLNEVWKTAKLTKLDLTYNDLEQLDGKALSEFMLGLAFIGTLKELSLVGNQFSDGKINAVTAFLLKHKQISKLRLASCDLVNNEPEGWEKFLEAMQSTKIKVLDISANGLGYLASAYADSEESNKFLLNFVGKCTFLQDLNISNNEIPKDMAIALLRKLLPRNDSKVSAENYRYGFTNTCEETQKMINKYVYVLKKEEKPALPQESKAQTRNSIAFYPMLILFSEDNKTLSMQPLLLRQPGNYPDDFTENHEQNPKELVAKDQQRSVKTIKH